MGTDVAEAVEGAGDAEVEGGETALAVAASPSKAKAAGIRKKLLGELGEKPIDEARAYYKNRLATADATVAEAAALEAAQVAMENAAIAEYEQATKEVEDAIAKEAEATSAYRSINDKREAA